MNVLSWVFFGIIIGIIVNVLDDGAGERSFLGASLLGIIGAVLGGFFANLVFGFGVRGFDITAFLLAVSGSFLILTLGKVVRAK